MLKVFSCVFALRMMITNVGSIRSSSLLEPMPLWLFVCGSLCIVFMLYFFKDQIREKFESFFKKPDNPRDPDEFDK